MRYKKILLILCGVILLVLGAGYYYHQERNREVIAIINGGELVLETAKTSSARAKGLSGRNELCSKCGMIFYFEEEGRYNFWMKDMFIPLDFIWLSGELIVDTKKNVALDYDGMIQSTKKFDKVIEINAGKIEEYDIKVGDLIIFE